MYLFLNIHRSGVLTAQRERERERERERQRDRETERQRETERERDRQTDRQRKLSGLTFEHSNKQTVLVRSKS